MSSDKFIQPLDGIEVTPAGGPQILLDQETLDRAAARIAAGEDRDKVLTELAIMQVDLEQELQDEGLMPEPELPHEEKVTSAASKESRIHREADSHLDALTTVVRRAFSLGRQALGTPPNVDAAVDAIKTNLEKTFPSVLAKVHQTGYKVAADRFRAAEDYRAARRGKTVAKLKMDFEGINESAVDWADKHAAELIDGISETTREDINNAIADALERGTIEDAYDEILAAVGDVDRAELIARTEVMMAANAGQRQAWNDAIDDGLLAPDAQRTWIATPDELICPECSDLDGEVIDMDGQYSDGSDGPPAHPRCRCTEGIV